MSTQAEREFELYRKDDHEARAILDNAAEENRDTTPEEDARFDALMASAQKHKERSDRLMRDAESASRLEQELRDRLGSMADAHDGSPVADKAGTRNTDAEIIAAIREAQAHIKGEGTSAGFRERVFSVEPDAELLRNSFVDRDEIRTISNFGNAGTLWIADFATRVAVYQRTMSPWFGLASLQTSDNGRDLRLPYLSADPTSYEPGEGTAITPADPTLGTATLTTTSYKALGYITAEADEDEVIGYLPLLARVQGRSVGFRAGTAMTTTILTGATNGGTATGVGGDGTATVAFFGYEDLLNLKYGAAVQYRNAGVWIVSNDALKKIRKFKDSNRQYYWQPAIAAGQPASFDGDPIYEDPGLATAASASKSVLFGDPQSVVIKQVPLRVAVSTEYAFNLDNVAIKTVLRAGAAVWDPAGLRYLVSANS